MPQRKRGKSVRQPTKVNNQLVRKKVKRYIALIVIFVLVYGLFFSNYFRIKYIQIVGNQAINTDEIETIIWDSLDKNKWLIFPRDNFWLVSTDYLLDEVSAKYAFEDITITKRWPDTISMRLIEKVGRLVWQVEDNYYVVDAQGMITRQLAGAHLIKQSDIPVINDTANKAVEISQNILSANMTQAIIDTAKLYSDYVQAPQLEFARFEINSEESNYFKVITSSGIEIHLNDAYQAEEQLYKLKRVLDAGKINLNNIDYINLRIQDQVIYK